VGKLGNGQIKRNVKKTANEDINEKAWEWFVSVRAKNHRVSGPMIQVMLNRSLKNWGRLNSMHLTGGWRVFAKDIT
jgi:hypothetical protein